MLIATLALAMIFGGIAATAALIAGWSFLGALAVYSGAGLISVLMIILGVITISSLHGRKTGQLHPDAMAGN